MNFLKYSYNQIKDMFVGDDPANGNIDAARKMQQVKAL